MKHYLYIENYNNPILHARELQRRMKEEGLSQNKLAKKLGISRVRVTQILNLLKLPEKQQNYILRNGKEKMITERSLRRKLSNYTA
ncbi:MAG: helix-turn-helix domain-containing protein [Candidatus Bathyarchaeota archaeon]